MSTVEFNQQFMHMEQLLLSFAFRLTRNEEDARDLLQETAYKAYKYRNMYQPQTNLRAWLMTIMRNTFINDYRKRKRRQSLSQGREEKSWACPEKEVLGNGGESKVAAQEIWQQINALEDWMRTPFLMYFNGYKYDEIAEHLGIPLGTVKSRIYFARQRLRKELREMYSQDALRDMLSGEVL